MHETYRMLGREREKDLERAVSCQRGRGVERRSRREPLRMPLRLVLAGTALRGLAARAGLARAAFRVRS